MRKYEVSVYQGFCFLKYKNISQVGFFLFFELETLLYEIYEDF